MIEALGADGASATGDLDDYALQRRVSVKLDRHGRRGAKPAPPRSRRPSEAGRGRMPCGACSAARH